MIFQFGNVEFETLTGFSSLSVSKENNFIEMPRMDAKPTIQNAGGVLDKIEGSIRIHYSTTSKMTVSERIDLLEQAFNKGKEETFIDGTGKIYGKFVIKSINKDIEQTDLMGRIISATLSISFLEFVETKTQGIADLRPKKEAFASIYTNPIQVKKKELYQSDTNLIMKNIVTGQSAAAALSDSIKKASFNLDTAQAFLNKGARSLSRADTALRFALLNVDNIGGKINNAAALKSSINSVISDLSNVKSNYTVNNIVGLKTIISGMDNNLIKLNGVASFLRAVTVLRK